MAHEIAQIGHMIFKGETPWHDMGVDVGDTSPQSLDDVLRLAPDADFQVLEKPLFFIDDNGQQIQVERKALTNSLTGEVLSTQSLTYRTTQIREGLVIGDAFLRNGLADFETFMILQGGKKVCMSLKLHTDPVDVVPGDTVKAYLMSALGNDGTLSIHNGLTSVRVVCNNTLRAALKDSNTQVRVRHTKKAIITLDALKDAALAAGQTFQHTAEIWRDMAKHSCSESQLRAYIRAVIPGLSQKAKNDNARKDSEKANEIADLTSGSDFAELLQKPANLDVDAIVEKSGRTEDRIVELFESGRGTDIQGVRGTVWGAYNAVTEYLTHERGRSDDARFQNTMFGRIGQDALQEAQKLLSA